MGTLSPLSLERDEIEIARIEEYSGNVPVQDLDAAAISRAYAKMRKTGMSSSALHKTHQKLSQMMKQAVREEIILRNPLRPHRRREAPRGRRAPQPVRRAGGAARNGSEGMRAQRPHRRCLAGARHRRSPRRGARPCVG